MCVTSMLQCSLRDAFANMLVLSNPSCLVNLSVASRLVLAIGLATVIYLHDLFAAEGAPLSAHAGNSYLPARPSFITTRFILVMTYVLA